MTVEYVEHVADVGLRAEGASLDEAFEEAARGVMALMVDPTTIELLIEHPVNLEATSEEELLVAWLGELVAQLELQRLVFGQVRVKIDADGDVRRLAGAAIGERLDPDRHRPLTEVKGISYLGLCVQRSAGGWTAACVLDV